MRKLLRRLGFAALAFVATVALSVAVFWFTIPPGPTLAEGFEPPAPDSTVTEPALRAELLRRLALDQAVRVETVGESGPDLSSAGGLWRLAQNGVRMRRVDGPNTEWIKEVVAERGWPTRAEVGADGRSALFFLVQHADHDAAFQRSALDPMREAYEAGDASGSNFAMLVDRIRKAEGKPQVYGSQFDQTPGNPWRLWPVEDEANVDARRAEMRLPPLSEYLARSCAELKVCVER